MVYSAYLLHFWPVHWSDPLQAPASYNIWLSVCLFLHRYNNWPGKNKPLQLNSYISQNPDWTWQTGPVFHTAPRRVPATSGCHLPPACFSRTRDTRKFQSDTWTHIPRRRYCRRFYNFPPNNSPDHNYINRYSSEFL